jgi:hypothetical protein
MGTVLGGVLISKTVSESLLGFDIPVLETGIDTAAESAILIIMMIYLLAALINLRIPDTGARYVSQKTNPIELVKDFAICFKTLWDDRLGQISLAVTTLFWGAGATLQLMVIEWGRSQLGYRLDQASILMGITAIGTIIGAVLAGRVSLPRALTVLPLGVAMGCIVLLMPFVQSSWTINILGIDLPWAAYILLILIGLTSGYFVVPMNALLQHRGHVLLSAGHSIAVQNFNEQLNILLMVAIYTLLLWLNLSISIIIAIFGVLVAGMMLVLIRWNQINLKRNPKLLDEIGQEGHGKAL